MALFKKIEAFYLADQKQDSMECIRIGLGGLCAVYGCLLFPERHVWFGNYGTFFPPVARVWNTLAIQPLLWLPPAPQWITICFVFFILSSIFFALGLFTRPMIWVSFLSLLSIQNRNLQAMYGGDVLLKQFLFYLALSPVGKNFTLRQWFQKRDSVLKIKPRPILAQRLFQIQMSIIYFSATLWKLRGATWRDGTALYYSVTHQLYGLLVPSFIFDHFWISRMMTWTGLAIELVLGVFIWVPKLRLPLIVLGGLFHLSMALLINVPYWQIVMGIGLLSFVEDAQCLQIVVLYRKLTTRHRATGREPQSLSQAA